MKKLLFIITILLLFTSCNKQNECLTYDEAVAQGKIEDKTSSIVMNDSIQFTLDHVLDKSDETYGKYCVGVLNLRQEEFSKTTREFLKGYNLKNVNQITIFTEGIDMCNEDVCNLQEAKGYLIYYLDDKDYFTMDYINVETREKETHKVNNAYGSVIVYYLFNKAKPKNLAGGVTIKNKSFNIKDAKFIKKEQDTILHKVHNRPMQ